MFCLLKKSRSTFWFLTWKVDLHNFFFHTYEKIDHKSTFLHENIMIENSYLCFWRCVVEVLALYVMDHWIIRTSDLPIMFCLEVKTTKPNHFFKLHQNENDGWVRGIKQSEWFGSKAVIHPGVESFRDTNSTLRIWLA